MCSDIKRYYNIFTGEEVNNVFEALGYKYYADDSKKIYTKLNNEEKEYDFRTNTELCFNDLKFIICQDKAGELIILFNVTMENDIENQVRQSFTDGWTFFKSAYFIDGNECSFKWLNNSFFIRIN